MFDFTLEWTNLRSPAERAVNAREVTDRIDIREAVILLIAFLFALGIMTSARLHERADRALLYASFGSMGMPMLLPSSDSCRRPLNLGSAPRLRHADVLALLKAD
jgi:hypothetical protein